MSCQISHVVALVAAAHAAQEGDHATASDLVGAPRRRHGGDGRQAAVLDGLDTTALERIHARLIALEEGIQDGTVAMPRLTTDHVHRCVLQVQRGLADTNA